jgi:hypothetical protein
MPGERAAGEPIAEAGGSPSPMSAVPVALFNSCTRSHPWRRDCTKTSINFQPHRCLAIPSLTTGSACVRPFRRASTPVVSVSKVRPRNHEHFRGSSRPCNVVSLYAAISRKVRKCTRSMWKWGQQATSSTRVRESPVANTVTWVALAGSSVRYDTTRSVPPYSRWGRRRGKRRDLRDPHLGTARSARQEAWHPMWNLSTWPLPRRAWSRTSYSTSLAAMGW